MKRYFTRLVLMVAAVLLIPAIVAAQGSEKTYFFKNKFSTNLEGSFYSWRDASGNRGRQVIAPVTLSYRWGGLDIGLRRAFINSSFDGIASSGTISTWSDTSLATSYTFKRLSWPVRFNLDLNLPTGKATLNGDEKKAIMDGSLVQQTRFGEGLNLAPGINVTHAFGKKIIFGFGAGHTIRGKFDPNGDVINDEIDPGDETMGTLQLQYRSRIWYVNAGTVYTVSGVTKRSGLDYYKKGDRIDGSIYAGVAVVPSLMLRSYFRYSTQKPDRYINNWTGHLEQEAANSNGDSYYGSFSVDKTFARKHVPRLMVDYLLVNANSYDQINWFYNAGRKKFSYGAGYDYLFSSRGTISLQFKSFQMLDKANPDTLRDMKYNGYSLCGSVNYDF